MVVSKAPETFYYDAEQVVNINKSSGFTQKGFDDSSIRKSAKQPQNSEFAAQTAPDDADQLYYSQNVATEDQNNDVSKRSN